MKHLVVLISIIAFTLNVRGSVNLPLEKRDFLSDAPEIVQKYSHCLDEFGSFSMNHAFKTRKLGFMKQKKDFQGISFNSKSSEETNLHSMEREMKKMNNLKEKLDFSPRYKRRRPDFEKDYSWELLGIFAGSILLDAAGDGLNDSGHKVWGHGLNAASTGVLLASPFIIDIKLNKWRWYAGSYMLMRVGLFDFTYNAVRGLPLDYIGNSSVWDKVMQEFRPDLGGQIWGRGIALTWGISIVFIEF